MSARSIALAVAAALTSATTLHAGAPVATPSTTVSPPNASSTAPVVTPPTQAAPTLTAPTSTAPTSTAPTSTAPTSTAPTSTAPTPTTPTLPSTPSSAPGPTTVAVRAAADAFDKPTAIAPNVAFWKRVYAEWSVNEIAFHDDEDFSLVYRVVRVPPRGGVDAAGHSRKDVVRAAQREVEAALKSLHKKQPRDDSALSGLEKEIFTSLRDVPRADKYARASHIRSQNGLRERFLQGYQNSGQYDAFIRAELTRQGLPEDLICVAFVESLFFTGARSKVGAAGIWQFMPYTGREYVQLNDVVDERWDPILATEAAAKYLKQAKKELGTWPLAVTSYNYGRGGMRALVHAAGTSDFNTILAVTKGKRFGIAARNYYASVLAIKELLDDKKAVSALTKKPAWSYEVVRTPFALFTSQLLATGVVDAITFASLNPGLSTEALASKAVLPHGMSLRVPVGVGADLVAKLQALPAAERTRGMRVVTTLHKATGRQRLAEIARQHRVVPGELAQRVGIDVDALPPKGTLVPIPASIVRTTLLPEARAIELVAPSEDLPILTAQNAISLDDKAIAIPRRVGLSDRAAAALASLRPSKGEVRVGAITTLALVDALPALDVIAGGRGASLPELDVVAGARDAPAVRAGAADAVSAADGAASPPTS